jgi:hypothetical protein
MRILYTLLIFFSLGLSVILGQNPVPKGMSYQAVVRNSSGNLVANATVGIVLASYKQSQATTLFFLKHTSLQLMPMVWLR